MREAFLIHVGSVWEAIKKKGYFKAYKDANEAYVEQCELVKQVNTLAKLDGTTSKGTGSSRKSSKKSKEAAATACWA
jgi:hypothetical protein